MDRETFSVSCYTIGCPYVGNQAFVNDFESTIDCAWDLFHPNDAVSITGKWYIMYARCSQVCLVSRFGDLVLNPSRLERVSLRPFALRRVKEHLLSTYANSFASVMEKWEIIEEYAPSKENEDSLSYLYESNPAVADLMALLESLSPSLPEASSSKSQAEEKSVNAGSQLLMPVVRAWNALDLDIHRRPRWKNKAVSRDDSSEK